ncbi:uncharacterized protein C2845_PM02G15260 [Panicum miliaceum]|uniref:Protein TIFY n=1 Tax=Panicum miliaceum TaxID=4540 RepID=A0A3L6SCJ7_PANMI|nr:uncharacterized protein C2845_PM02G15260 [Panicum miliaceum]
MAGAGPGRRSRFAVTCALLRQYMREKESQRQVRMGNLARVLQAPPPTPVAPQESDERTMQLFPVPVHATAAMAQPPAYQERPEAAGKTPMTIFYGGQVMLFDHIPAEKANEVMHMAGSSVNAPPAEKVVVDVPEASEPSAGVDQQTIARKASLQRFLQKRKRRIGGNNPDDLNEDAAPAKKMDAGGSGERMEDVPDALWLRL